MTFENLLVEVDEGTAVATVTIDRPEKLNAISMAMRASIVEAFEQLGRDERVRVIVVKGSGDRAFSAGGDIPEFARVPTA